MSVELDEFLARQRLARAAACEQFRRPRRKPREPQKGSAWRPGKRAETPRAPRGLRHVGTEDRAAVGLAFDGYKWERLEAQFAPGMRSILASLPPVPRAQLRNLAARAAGLTAWERTATLVPVEDDAGRWAIACTWEQGEGW